MRQHITTIKLAPKPMFFELEIKNPPPVLALLINPSNFNLTLTKKVIPYRTRPTSRNRAAYNMQYAHDELDVLACSGTSAMFYNKNGLTKDKERETIGFRNFKSLVEIYRNNGINYNDRQKTKFVTGGDGLIVSVGRVIIAYDDIIYKGSFDSFSIEETDVNPYNLKFDFQFTVSEKIDIRND